MKNMEKNIEIKKLDAEISALDKTIRELEGKRDNLRKMDRDVNAIYEDWILKDDIDIAELNYILGQSAGYVDGFKSAMSTVISELSCDYRDIPMTEAELYLLVELGELSARASMKNMRQIKIAQDSGWQMDWMNRPRWIKESDGNEQSE